MRKAQVEECVNVLYGRFKEFPYPAALLQIPKARIFYDAVATTLVRKYWLEYLLNQSQDLAEGPTLLFHITQRGAKQYDITPSILQGSANVGKINIIPISIRGLVNHQLVAIAYPSKVIEFFEPYGTDRELLPWQESVEASAIEILRAYYPGYKIKRAVSVCPRFSWQKEFDTTRGLCVAWAFLFVYLRVICDIPSSILVKELLTLNHKKVLGLLFYIIMDIWTLMDPALASMMKTYLLLVGIDFVENKDNKIGFYSKKRTQSSLMSDETRRQVVRNFSNQLRSAPNYEERQEMIDHYYKKIIDGVKRIYGGKVPEGHV